jgi:hypothetical protein
LRASARSFAAKAAGLSPAKSAENVRLAKFHRKIGAHTPTVVKGDNKYQGRVPNGLHPRLKKEPPNVNATPDDVFT